MVQKNVRIPSGSILLDNLHKVLTEEIDDNHFKATVTVSPFPTFYRWMFGFNWAMKIKSPKGVIDKYKTMARKALES